MRIVSLAGTVCAAVVCLAAVGAAGEALFDQSFQGGELGDGPGAGWRVDSGYWKRTAEGLVGWDCEGGFVAMGVTTGARDWRHYTLRLKLKVLSRGGDWRDGPWIGVRYRGARDTYTVGFYERGTVVHKASAGKGTGDGTELAAAARTVRVGRWHDVAVTVAGPRVRVVLDGRPIIDAIDADLKVAGQGWNASPVVGSGGIVLAARKWPKSSGATRVVFKDLVVTPETYTPADAQRDRQAVARRIAFLEELRTRRWPDVKRRVMAFYYPWYGTPVRHKRWVHWDGVKPAEHDIATSTHYPAAGAYDSHDPAVIRRHMRQAMACGIDTFICSWWGKGSFSDRAMPEIIKAAGELGMTVSVYWERVPESPKGTVDAAAVDIDYVVKRFGSSPAFLKVAGKPVVFVYGRVMQQIAFTQWPDVVQAARERCGVDFLLVADGYREHYADVFDGVHTYNICGAVRGKSPEALRAWAGKAFARAVAMARKRGKIACLTVIPGYDDTKIRKPGLNAERLDGKVYEVLWSEAIAARPDWVLITSWNEWHEGSEIEPSREYGDRYLSLTGPFARRFTKAAK